MLLVLCSVVEDEQIHYTHRSPTEEIQVSRGEHYDGWDEPWNKKLGQRLALTSSQDGERL